MTLFTPLCKTKWDAGLFVFALLRATAERGWSCVQVKEFVKYTIAPLSLSNSKWLREGLCLCPHTTAVSLWAHSGQRGHTHSRDWASLDVSFKTHMLSVLYIYLLAGFWQVPGSTPCVSYPSSEHWAELMWQLKANVKPPFLFSCSILTPLSALIFTSPCLWMHKKQVLYFRFLKKKKKLESCFIWIIFATTT